MPQADPLHVIVKVALIERDVSIAYTDVATELLESDESTDTLQRVHTLLTMAEWWLALARLDRAYAEAHMVVLDTTSYGSFPLPPLT